jgi:hypothetical protein
VGISETVLVDGVRMAIFDTIVVDGKREAIPKSRYDSKKRTSREKNSERWKSKKMTMRMTFSGEPMSMLILIMKRPVNNILSRGV